MINIKIFVFKVMLIIVLKMIICIGLFWPKHVFFSYFTLLLIFKRERQYLNNIKFLSKIQDKDKVFFS